MRSNVVEKGFKGKSRSKRLASPEESPRPCHAKISADIGQKRISANLDLRMYYKVCDEITEESGIVKQQ